ncbi:hypothetical protein BH23BAC4_BH23BAC4_15860 [soil metagenome]
MTRSILLRIAAASFLMLVLLTTNSANGQSSTSQIEQLLPQTLGGLALEEAYSDDSMPLYGYQHVGPLPALREGGYYWLDPEAHVHVGLVVLNAGFAALPGPEDEFVALRLLTFDAAQLTAVQYQGLNAFEGRLAPDPDGFMEERVVVAVPLGGHAILIVESAAPEVIGLTQMREMLGELDLGAFDRHTCRIGRPA